MDRSRIAELLTPFFDSSPSAARPSPAQLDQISTYIDLLVRWNSRVNLTAIRVPEEIVTRHFGESLFAARHLFPCGADTPVRQPAHETESSRLKHSTEAPASTPDKRTELLPDGPKHLNPNSPSPSNEFLVDIGSGAGFPGLPIKIWSPPTRVTLIESNHKKGAFLREVIRALTLMNVDVYSGRVQDFPPATATLATLRAVERFTDVLPLAERLLAANGRLVLLIGESQLQDARTVLPTLQWKLPLPVPLSKVRILACAQR